MIDEQQMKQAMQAYIDRYNKDDLDGVVDLYADDATVEDPVGSPVKKGKAVIRDFYAFSMKTGARLTLAAPIRASHGNAAAMAFDVVLNMRQGRMIVRVIDAMTFDDKGKFTSMRAYWGKTDMEQVSASGTTTPVAIPAKEKKKRA